MSEPTSTAATLPEGMRFRSATEYVRSILQANDLPLSDIRYGRKPNVSAGYLLSEPEPQVVMLAWTNQSGPQANRTAQAERLALPVEPLRHAGLEVAAPPIWRDGENRSALRIEVPTEHACTELAHAQREAEVYREMATRHITDIAHEIEGIADRCERIAADARRTAAGLRAHPSVEDAGRAISSTQSDLLWGVANMGLHHLTGRLADMGREEIHAAEYEEKYRATLLRWGFTGEGAPSES